VFITSTSGADFEGEFQVAGVPGHRHLTGYASVIISLMEACRMLGFDHAARATCTESISWKPHKRANTLNNRRSKGGSIDGTVQAEPKPMERVDPMSELGTILFWCSSQEGMHFDQYLMQLFKGGYVTLETARHYVNNWSRVEMDIHGFARSAGGHLKLDLAR
jgi:hypothetical protein